MDTTRPHEFLVWRRPDAPDVPFAMRTARGLILYERTLERLAKQLFERGATQLYRLPPRPGLMEPAVDLGEEEVHLLLGHLGEFGRLGSLGQPVLRMTGPALVGQAPLALGGQALGGQSLGGQVQA